MSWILDNASRAATQRGLLDRTELIQLGVGPDAIDHALSAGRLERVRPRVYRTPGAPDTFRQRILAAVLSAGPEAVASHRTAAILLGVARRHSPEVIDVTVPRLRNPRQAGVHLHRIEDLVREHCIVVEGIPCTGPLRLMVDLGAVEPRHIVDDVLERAVTSRLVTVLGVEWMLTELSKQGRRGAGVVRSILDERALGKMRADGLLEPRMARLIRAHGLPFPEFQHRVRTGNRNAYIDFAYPHLKRGFEVDGYEDHGGPKGMEKGFERDSALHRLGWIIDHFSWNHVVRRQRYVAEVMWSVLGRATAE